MSIVTKVTVKQPDELGGGEPLPDNLAYLGATSGGYTQLQDEEGNNITPKMPDTPWVTGNMVTNFVQKGESFAPRCVCAGFNSVNNSSFYFSLPFIFADDVTNLTITGSTQLFGNNFYQAVNFSNIPIKTIKFDKGICTISVQNLTTANNTIYALRFYDQATITAS